MEPLFQTKRISAVEAEAGDIPFIIRMENAAENRNFIWQGTKEQHLAEIADPEHILAVFRTADGNSIGYMLCHVDAKSDVFELRRIAIDIKGKGYGREAMEGTMRYAFEVLRMNRFWLDVYPDNTTGIRLYESLGMHRDGMLRQSYKSERGYLDQIVYSMLKDEYFARAARGMSETEALIGKCGFFCGSCPALRSGTCPGCRLAHEPGDCFTFDCVEAHGLTYCGDCCAFPCGELLRRKKATVLDADWLRWKRREKAALVTERLLLRRLTEEDFPKVFAILGDPEVMYAWEHGFSEEEAHEWLERTFKRYEEDGFGHYAVELRDTGEFVGMVGMIRETLGGKELLGIGWMLRKDCWGHGYATEAAQAVLHDAFERLGAKEIVADIRPENTASIRVAERLGMRAEYEVVKRYRGKDMPHIVYVIKKDK